MSEQKPAKIAIEGKEKYQRLLAGVPQTCGMKSGAMVLQPGDAVGEHVTEQKEEAIIILAGQAEVFVAGKPAFTAAAGELVYIPPQTSHDIKNCGAVPLKYIYVVTPV